MILIFTTRNFATTLTFLNSATLLRQTMDVHEKLVSTLSDRFGTENFETALFLQPLPLIIGKMGQAKGGNSLGLDRIPSNAILVDFGVTITNGDDAAFALAQAELASATTTIQNLAEQDGSAIDFVYMNYADTSQNPLGSYGSENIAFLSKVAAQYDPEGFWQDRVPGGFKISRVGK